MVCWTLVCVLTCILAGVTGNLDEIIRINQNAHVIGDLLDGDVFMPTKNTSEGEHSRHKRDVHIFGRWFNAIVPFTMEEDKFDDREKKVIFDSMAIIEAVSCVRFVTRHDERDYIFITRLGGCWSPIGRQIGKQALSIGYGCVSESVIVHEMLHALGFFHEHQRPDRNDYIEILWDNLQTSVWKQFIIHSNVATTLDLPYDYYSIMHYGK
ncbi:zinc metalloproteinase nas-4-like [Hydractinia symbiolongicarpus]|uniref:zinc metalloproteinase nas-4-like n=1 Tax=Hydractinia symbiolongicarpus TaxID=13093 RepID=UPI00254DDAC7|nr:zinc metalloproteinase nas-4-like [Hydractinia symbiolongicarpus]